jgi:hypothetical protein
MLSGAEHPFVAHRSVLRAKHLFPIQACFVNEASRSRNLFSVIPSGFYVVMGYGFLIAVIPSGFDGGYGCRSNCFNPFGIFIAVLDSRIFPSSVGEGIERWLRRDDRLRFTIVADMRCGMYEVG